MLKCPFCEFTNEADAKNCPKCGAELPQSNEDLVQQIRTLVEQDKKIEAIKVYRGLTGAGLREAKDAVEAIQRGETPELPSTPSSDTDAEVLRMLDRGEKIQAVKCYREQTGASLMEAKNAVESLGQRHGIAGQSTGCTTFAIGLVVLLFAIAIVVASMMLMQ